MKAKSAVCQSGRLSISDDEAAPPPAGAPEMLGLI